ncbi:MAG: efflux transporter outer membrane subunit [Bacteroidales bacterium]
MLKKYIWVLLPGAIFFTSCKIGKEYTRPEMNLPERIERDTPSDSMTVADLKWWQLYTDPQLRNLISEALENNKDILKAEAVIREFNQGKKIAFASMLPSLKLELEAEHEKSSKIDNSFGAKALFAWELDFWGKLRWANEGAKAKLLQTVEARRALQVSIIAQVVQTYYELIALDREYSIVKHTTNARKEAVRLAKLRFEGGLTSEIALKQAEAELAKTETLIPSLEYKIRVKESEMALILGKFDSNSLQRADKIEATPVHIPVGLPSELLTRRPDIQEAELAVKEANANVGVAFTSMFPSISLTAEGGLESGDLSQLLKSPIGLVGGGLLSPLFSFGKNRANWKRSEAKLEQAAISYEKKVLEAFKEVNIALISVRKSKEIRESRERSEAAARSYLELANLQYINGVISYMDVLDAQRSLLDAEISLNAALLNEKMATSSLYKSLGGGW